LFLKNVFEQIQLLFSLLLGLFYFHYVRAKRALLCDEKHASGGVRERREEFQGARAGIFFLSASIGRSSSFVEAFVKFVGYMECF
jgi:hypothetical protein